MTWRITSTQRETIARSQMRYFRYLLARSIRLNPVKRRENTERSRSDYTPRRCPSRTGGGGRGRTIGREKFDHVIALNFTRYTQKIF